VVALTETAVYLWTSPFISSASNVPKLPFAISTLPLTKLNAAGVLVNYKLKTYVYTHWCNDLSIFKGDIYPAVSGHYDALPCIEIKVMTNI